MPDRHIAIVGAGVVGASIAFFLTERGCRVTLIDRKGIVEETSAGNAGAFAFSDILPLASPGTILKAPKWLFDPLGPLSVPPAYLPQIAPWLYRFFRAGSPTRFNRSVKAQAALMHLAERETDALLSRASLEHMIVARGALHIYDNERSFAAAAKGWDLSARYDIVFEHLDRTGIERHQPGLAPQIRHATYVPAWRNVSDPKAYATALAERALAAGGEHVRASIVDIRPNENGVTLVDERGGSIEANAAVIAAGAWSHHLATRLGDRIPLETERGYNTTLAPDAFDLRCQLIFDDHGFVVSPLAIGVRVGGAVELGGLKRPPDFGRAKAMLDKAKRFMPGLKTEGGREWMGFRPSLPDSLPVIGRARSASRVIYAFGHGHLGLTQSAATGRLVVDLALDRPPEIPLDPYSPERF